MHFPNPGRPHGALQKVVELMIQVIRLINIILEALT